MRTSVSQQLCLTFIVLVLLAMGSYVNSQTAPSSLAHVCTLCGGAGTVRCNEPGCINGKKTCPGKCLKLSEGKWEKLYVAGHSPDELWQKFEYHVGRESGYQAWTKGHCGEVIVYENGSPSTKALVPSAMEQPKSIARVARAPTSCFVPNAGLKLPSPTEPSSRAAS